MVFSTITSELKSRRFKRLFSCRRNIVQTLCTRLFDRVSALAGAGRGESFRRCAQPQAAKQSRPRCQAALVLVLLVFVFAGCGDGSPAGAAPAGPPAPGVEQVDIAAVPPAVVLMPVASGTDARRNDKAEVDASNTGDGYIMVRYLGGPPAEVRVRVTGPSQNIYTYVLNSDALFEVFPLSDGDGPYRVDVYKHVVDNKYAAEFSTDLDVMLTDPFAPFLRPNQFVNFDENTLAVQHAAMLAVGAEADLDKVRAIYTDVITSFTYDAVLAENVQPDYLPDLDEVWRKQSGICFDYAAVMAAMLRSQGIPAKLVIGYAGDLYHAWINVFIEDIGWIDNMIYFDGAHWVLMDPTFASGGNASAAVMDFIGNEANYAAKYAY